MSRKLKINLILSIIVILLPAVVGIVLWDSMPETVPIHWNAHGEIDGYSSKLFLVAGLPVIFLVIHSITTLVTAATFNKTDEKKSGGLLIVIWLVPIISLCTSALTYSTAMGIHISTAALFPLLTCGVFVLTGFLLWRYPTLRAINFPTKCIATRKFTGILFIVLSVLSAVLSIFKLYYFIAPVPAVLVVLPIVYHFKRGRHIG